MIKNMFLYLAFIMCVLLFSCKKDVHLDNLLPNKTVENIPTSEEKNNSDTENTSKNKEKEDTLDALDIEEPSIRNASLEEKKELDTVYFDFDSSYINDIAKDILINNARWLKEHSDYKVLVAGHTDQRGSIKYNLGLGQDRASKVRLYLTYLGINADRIATISYGKEKLFSNEENEEAYAKNRRAEFFVYKK